ncbi:MAG: FAD/NAD(P)-binding oxidoreductase [Burkholderiaceae bacterium]
MCTGPDYAARTWQAASDFIERGGVDLFTRPATEMKCAGAPLKHVSDRRPRQAKRQWRSEIIYASSSTLFGVPIVAEKVRMLFADRGGIRPALSHVLKRIDRGGGSPRLRRDGDTELGYDYLHVVPPQRAPRSCQSGLSWADKWTDQGWVEVDKQTRCCLRYPDVFALGDVAGVPKGKTAASIVLECRWSRIIWLRRSRAGRARHIYNGYTSCPMITRVEPARC